MAIEELFPFPSHSGFCSLALPVSFSFSVKFAVGMCLKTSSKTFHMVPLRLLTLPQMSSPHISARLDFIPHCTHIHAHTCQKKKLCSHLTTAAPNSVQPTMSQRESITYAFRLGNALAMVKVT